ncbi:DUF3426 domain-containing protein [Marilutibacter alkalisoli]|uniref:DUF3426 domain-containing protein n=1 Tax=Marilutibacter alkalisoli TaxID=2591633 RepID=A0A514BNW3_9GAMM|nr:DUF3426 domain-containing protein [Lysobacter alkalisoli]QDH69062.1 DUF3426 domain-containing protein [Lysobacter alkalisoli]
MFIPCPNCGFLVALAAKRTGRSQHCPRCNTLLEEDTATSATPPAEATADTPQQPPTATTSGKPAEPAQSSPPLPPTPAPPVPAASSGPSFTRVRVDPHASAPQWPLLLTIAGLAALLALQLLLAQRAELAGKAQWRPLMTALCTVLRCDLPPWHQPAAYVMLDRSVRPIADRPGVLQVNASFRNDARWAQAWPTLVLSLSDADGRQVGQRAFAPGDYHGTHAADDRLESGQSATVAFEVVEPAPNIVAFTFDFR